MVHWVSMKQKFFFFNFGNFFIFLFFDFEPKNFNFSRILTKEQEEFTATIIILVGWLRLAPPALSFSLELQANQPQYMQSYRHHRCRVCKCIFCATYSVLFSGGGFVL